jgi:hypothetical protein
MSKSDRNDNPEQQTQQEESTIVGSSPKSHGTESLVEITPVKATES